MKPQGRPSSTQKPYYKTENILNGMPQPPSLLNKNSQPTNSTLRGGNDYSRNLNQYQPSTYSFGISDTTTKDNLISQKITNKGGYTPSSYIVSSQPTTGQSYLQQYLQQYRTKQYNETSSIKSTQSTIVSPQQQLQSQMSYSDSTQSLAKQPAKGVVGLRNIGNTCFMNSVLQCLINLPNFNEYFVNGQYSKDLSRKGYQVAQEYSRFISNVRSASKFAVETPSSLKSAVESIAPSFRGYNQQDAQEFMVALLDGISTGINRIKSNPSYSEMNDKLDGGKTLQDLSNDWWNYSKSREDSIVLDHFQGQLLNQLKCCGCQHDSYAFDTFTDISLAFSRGFTILEDVELERLIELYLQEEIISEAYCDKCKKLQKAKKRLIFWRLPDILIFHIKRFNFRRFSSDKLNHRLIFKEILDLGKIAKESTDKSTKQSQYQLFGIVNHSGNLYGGHYTADCKNPFDNQWYRFNDSYVNEISFRDQGYETKGSSNPYIVFYAKKK